jgi:hypothetical protein
LRLEDSPRPNRLSKPNVPTRRFAQRNNSTAAPAIAPTRSAL